MQLRHAVHSVIVVAAATIALWSPAHAAWMWDQDNDKLDDRMAVVESQGLAAAHKGGVLSGRLQFDVTSEAGTFTYGVYIEYDHHPTDADAAALTALGLPIHRRYFSIDYVRSRLDFAQAQQVAQLPGVTRVETIPMMYAVNNVGTRAHRARDSGQELYPNVWQHLGITGKGIVVGILDTGVNDEAFGSYPGHESLRGKFLGGGDFQAGDPAANTPLDQSVNPRHNADALVTYHATHVAGTAIGTGGPQGMLNGATPGFHAGMAPDARLVDCKVLTDAGRGGGSADALDWCVYHRFDDWGLSGPDSIYRGIDVINMSLGTDTESDGTDANCKAVNAAVAAGIVVCVSSGNDGNTDYMPSPAAADLAITVGALTDNNSIRREDDVVADYSNEGPRTSDNDGSLLDEMKPNVLGSGTGITSALGDPAGNGDRYHHINGTSMACPMMSGLAALILSANPTLTPAQVRDIIQDTAEHRVDNGKQVPAAVDPFGLDPNYHPSWGWGEVDAYAAVKEALNRFTTQVVRIAATPQRGPDGIVVSWWSQREVELSRFELDRAPDMNGAPGAWGEIAEIAVAAPVTEIHGVPNRHAYDYTDLDGSLDPDAHYWYRVRWVDSEDRSHAEPPVRARIADSPVLARVLFSWTHDFSDGDLLVRYGTGTNTMTPVWFRQAEGRFSADSIISRTGVNVTGTLQHYFHVDLTVEDGAATFLPPSAANPWFLSVKEGGYADTHGKVNEFAVTVFGPGAPTTYAATDPTTETVEKQETVFWIPLNPVTSANHHPVLDPVGTRQVSEGLPLTIELSASDADGTPLTYSAGGLPSGATFDAGARTMTWTPGFDDAGSYGVRFRVFEDLPLAAAADSEDITITVVDRAPGDDQAPILDPQTDRHVVTWQQLQFRVTATDPEGQTVSYGATGLPGGASLDPTSGVVSWTPVPTDIGIHPITITATDPGGHSDAEDFHLVVSPPGTAASNCTPETAILTGVIGMGVDPGPKSYAYHAFTVPSGTNAVYGRLSWFGSSGRDLDLYLLNSDSTVVHQSASFLNPEALVKGGLAPGTYLWQVVAFTNPDTAHYELVSELCIETATTGTPHQPMPRELSLAPRPNPFHGLLAVHFTLPASGAASLELFDASGRRVRTLQRGWLPAGDHVRVWDGRTDHGATAAPGVYFSKLVAGGQSVRKKVIQLK